MLRFFTAYCGQKTWLSWNRYTGWFKRKGKYLARWQYRSL